jgi:hypothetical protein
MIGLHILAADPFPVTLTHFYAVYRGRTVVNFTWCGTTGNLAIFGRGLVNVCVKFSGGARQAGAGGVVIDVAGDGR